MANISFAEDMRYYDVEIIIIENISKNAKNSENWPLQVNLTPEEKTVQLGQPFEAEWLPEDTDLKSSYIVLDDSAYQLTKEAKKISNSKTHRVIFHTAWRQPGLNKKQALPIYFKTVVPAPKIVEDKKEVFEEISSFSDEQTEAPASVLEGILRVTLARYLHLEAELTFQDKSPDMLDGDNPFAALDVEMENNIVQKQGVIHLKQKRRRIRSNELHYVDHPVLGILLKITPYIEEEKNTT